MARHYPTPLALRAWGRRAPRPLARPSHEASSPQAKEPTASLATRCYRIREGPRVNVDVTAAGATLALGLLFCKSNNASVAAQLEALLHVLRDEVQPLAYVPLSCSSDVFAPVVRIPAGEASVFVTRARASVRLYLETAEP